MNTRAVKFPVSAKFLIPFGGILIARSSFTEDQLPAQEKKLSANPKRPENRNKQTLSVSQTQSVNKLNSEASTP
jgi:hypothetical protein